MSNCCTPEFITIPYVSPTGDIIVARATGTGDAPSCGYYKSYSGSIELNYYDYYTVDVQYNQLSGVWTFSGNSTGFNDSTVYVKAGETGQECYPIGNYTGGLYDPVMVDTAKPRRQTYEFSPAFDYQSDVSVVSRGSGVHLNRDVNFSFSFKDNQNVSLETQKEMSTSPNFKGCVFDILDEEGTTIKENYLSGYLSAFKFSEQDNQKVFGSYNPNFAVRARTLDSVLGSGGVAEIYTYGNYLEIASTEVSDRNGYKTWGNTEGGSYVSGFDPSGTIESEIKIKTKFLNDLTYTKPSHIDIHIGDTPNFEASQNNFSRSVQVENGRDFKEMHIDESWNLLANKDYWFVIKPSSKIGYGQAMRFGPQRLDKKLEVVQDFTTSRLNLSYESSSLDIQYKTGIILEYSESGSGILDKLLVDSGNYGLVTETYDIDNKLLYSTIPTTTEGLWQVTTFDYLFEFKDSNNPYNNISKKVNITATGQSQDPSNSGLPLFSITQDPTGQLVDVSLSYNQSGIHVLANTGHQFDLYKHQRTSL